MHSSTPSKLDISNQGYETNDQVLEIFSQLKISAEKISPNISDSGRSKTKRSVEQCTVEGSPLNISKRIDILPTPMKFERSIIQSSFQPFPSQTKLNALLDSTAVAVFSVGDDSIHDTGSHQENSLRTQLLSGKSGCLRRSLLAQHVHMMDKNIKPAQLTDLLRVHEYSYIRHLEAKCKQASGHLYIPSDTSLESKLPHFYAPGGMLDADTPLTGQSLLAAKMFCGAAIVAIDLVMKPVTVDEKHGEYSRAFVIGRPPGHHAGPMGCVAAEHHWRRPDMTSSGFCLLNTVAVAAAYARNKYSCPGVIRQYLHDPNAEDKVQGLKVAIVDIDIHHGNGTEEIVRHLKPHTRYLPLPSSCPPVGELAYKPWLNESDPDNVLFASIHLFAEERFYPGTGREKSVSNNAIINDRDDDPDKNIVNVCLTPIGPGPWDPRARSKLNLKQRTALRDTASKELRRKVEGMLLPRLKQFSPELLLISAGFDAHQDDLYHFLDEEDFHWLTTLLCSTVCPGGRVVSILEGGYSLSAPYESPSVSSSFSNDTLSVSGTRSARTERSLGRNETLVSVSSESQKLNVQVQDVEHASITIGDKENCSTDNSQLATMQPSLDQQPDTTNSINLSPDPISVSISDKRPPHKTGQGRGKGRKPGHILTSNPSSSSTTLQNRPLMVKYGQLPGDGGLVKGVLAHLAAMAGVSQWTVSALSQNDNKNNSIPEVHLSVQNGTANQIRNSVSEKSKIITSETNSSILMNLSENNL